MNIFLSAYQFERPVTEIVWCVVPFFLVLVAAVLVLTYACGQEIGRNFISFGFRGRAPTLR